MPIYWTAASIPGFADLSGSERRRAFRLAVRHLSLSRRIGLGFALCFGACVIGAWFAIAWHLGGTGFLLVMALGAGIGSGVASHVITREALPFIPDAIAEVRNQR